MFFKKKKFKNVCLPYLNFSDPLPQTHLFFYLELLSTHTPIPTHNNWTSSFPYLSFLGCYFFFFIQILKYHKKDARLIWVKRKLSTLFSNIYNITIYELKLK